MGTPSLSGNVSTRSALVRCALDKADALLLGGALANVLRHLNCLLICQRRTYCCDHPATCTNIRERRALKDCQCWGAPTYGKTTISEPA